MNQYGVIDVGSNSVRMCIYRCTQEVIRVLFTKKETVGLAGYVEDGRLSDAGIERCIEALAAFQELAAHFDLDSLSVFATASLRNIQNTDEAVERIQEKTGLNVDVILGREEAICDYVGATQSVGLSDGLVIDIGGGSIEVVGMLPGLGMQAASIDSGSLSLFAAHVSGLFPTKEERKRIRETVQKKLEKLEEFQSVSAEHICGIGGTIRAAGKLYRAMYGLPQPVRSFPADAVKEIFSEIKKPDKKALDLILRVAPERIHTLVPGLAALTVLLDWFQAKQVHISSYGVREGYLYRHVRKEEPPHVQIVGL